ncbi:hypothetical protein MP638_004493 [Amoeboaphelidium occidentale]|nr:hypothetical protein MP638_004493 [Amoeboaphelidium occidentale]
MSNKVEESIESFLDEMARMTCSDSPLLTSQPKTFKSFAASPESSSSGLFRTYTSDDTKISDMTATARDISCTDQLAPNFEESEMNRRMAVLSEKAELMLMVAELMETAAYWKIKAVTLEKDKKKSVEAPRDNLRTFNKAIASIHGHRDRSSTSIMGPKKSNIQAEQINDISNEDKQKKRRRRATFSTKRKEHENENTDLIKSVGSLLKQLNEYERNLSKAQGQMVSIKKDREDQLKKVSTILEHVENLAVKLKNKADTQQVTVTDLRTERIPLLRFYSEISQEINGIKQDAVKLSQFCEEQKHELNSNSRTELKLDAIAPEETETTSGINNISKMSPLTRNSLLSEIRKFGGKLRKSPEKLDSGNSSFDSTCSNIYPSIKKARDIRETLKEALERQRESMFLDDHRDEYLSSTEDELDEWNSSLRGR